MLTVTTDSAPVVIAPVSDDRHAPCTADGTITHSGRAQRPNCRRQKQWLFAFPS